MTSACPGNTHDLTGIATSTAAGPLAASGVTVLADKDYIGIAARLGLTQAFTPKRRRKTDDRSEPVREAEGVFKSPLAHNTSPGQRG